MEARLASIEYEMLVEALRLHLGNTTPTSSFGKITRKSDYCWEHSNPAVKWRKHIYGENNEPFS
jgi:hypothetical protein